MNTRPGLLYLTLLCSSILLQAIGLFWISSFLSPFPTPVAAPASDPGMQREVIP